MTVTKGCLEVSSGFKHSLQMEMGREDQVNSLVLKPEEKPQAGPCIKWNKAIHVPLIEYLLIPTTAPLLFH